MLIPNVDATITKATGSFDQYGQATLGATTAVRCAIVKLVSQREKTTVRADSSATRGFAYEITADARLLFLPTTSIAVGDQVMIAGVKLVVISVFPRYDIPGRFDHWQVDANVWA